MNIQPTVIAPVCDYDAGDLAWGEILDRLCLILPSNVRISIPTAVPSFNTIFTGFCIGQRSQALIDRGCRLICFGNTAPRKDRGDKAKTRNEGENLVYGVLDNGAELLVVNAGHALSFVREQLKELWKVQVDEGGTQFRSRDRYPEIISMLVTDNYAFKGEKLQPQKAIPPIPQGVVGLLESFQNIKTTYRVNDPQFTALKPGQVIKVRINNIIHNEVYVATGSFNVKANKMAFAPGSSGFDDRYLELFLRGGHAGSYFGLNLKDETIAHALADGMPVEILT